MRKALGLDPQRGLVLRLTQPIRRPVVIHINLRPFTENPLGLGWPPLRPTEAHSDKGNASIGPIGSSKHLASHRLIHAARVPIRAPNRNLRGKLIHYPPHNTLDSTLPV